MHEQEYIALIEKKLTILVYELIEAQKLLGFFSQRHYADGLTKAQIIKMSNDYFINVNRKYEESKNEVS